MKITMTVLMFEIIVLLSILRLLVNDKRLGIFTYFKCTLILYPKGLSDSGIH